MFSLIQVSCFCFYFVFYFYYVNNGSSYRANKLYLVITVTYKFLDIFAGLAINDLLQIDSVFVTFSQV